ncbi:MAG: thioredoxin-disulfide reductase [Endomicrobium sp.]|jgi:thioredoxin reductase (NADPH)|nr:thioredoxin-disulfide reductase [Endomicrobium sp.]
MIYDVIVIGGGPSGLSATIYSSRAKLKTLLIEKNACGGQLLMIDSIDNYPGFNEGIGGFDFAVKLERQARDFNAELIYDEVVSIEYNCFFKRVITKNSLYETKTIIIATGTFIRKMNVPGESEFIGKGVSFCAICDAPFYRDKNVLVIGGGDSAIQEAVYLSRFAKRITVIHRRNNLKAMKIFQERIALCQNISVLYNSVVKEILGKDFVEKVVVTNIKTHEDKCLSADGVFVFIGLIPNTLFLPSAILDEANYIITDENMNTSIFGIFACGDIRKKRLRQIVTAISDGAQAAISAQNYVEAQKS